MRHRTHSVGRPTGARAGRLFRLSACVGVLTLGVPGAAARAETPPNNPYWENYRTETCGYLPDPRPMKISATKALVGATADRRDALAGARPHGAWRRDSEIEGRLASGPEALWSLTADLRDGMSRDAAQAAYADRFAWATIDLADVDGVRRPPEPLKEGRPRHMIRQAYLRNLRELVRRNAAALDAFAAWSANEGRPLENGLDADASTMAWLAGFRAYAGAQAALLRQELASGRFLTGTRDQISQICLANGLDLLLSAAARLRAGEPDDRYQRAKAVASVYDWKRRAKGAWLKQRAQKYGAAAEHTAYEAAAAAFAFRLESTGTSRRYPTDDRQFVQLERAFDAMIDARRRLLEQLARAL